MPKKEQGHRDAHGRDHDEDRPHGGASFKGERANARAIPRVGREKRSQRQRECVAASSPDPEKEKEKNL